MLKASGAAISNLASWQDPSESESEEEGGKKKPPGARGREREREEGGRERGKSKGGRKRRKRCPAAGESGAAAPAQSKVPPLPSWRGRRGTREAPAAAAPTRQRGGSLPAPWAPGYMCAPGHVVSSGLLVPAVSVLGSLFLPGVQHQRDLRTQDR